MTKILIAEDEMTFREAVAEILSDSGFEVETAENGRIAWEKFQKAPADIVVTDIRMPEMDGLNLLEKIHEFLPGAPVIMITAHGSLDTAIEALRCGAIDYVTKPCDLDELQIRIERVLEHKRLQRKAAILEQDTRAEEFGEILGKSEEMRRVYRLIDKVASTPSTVLVTGESGTGKELVAREIHRKSERERFVPVNCGAIPENLLESELFGHRKGSFTGATNHNEGLFRLADGGTLFLDEIGELPSILQVKLLRALDRGEIQPVGAPGPIKCTPRIIVATNRNLEEEVTAGNFREDLFFRLNVFEVDVPPLRDRPDDIPILVKHFVAFHSVRSGRNIESISPAALRALMAGGWRGNVRELENVIERAIILAEGSEIEVSDLPVSFTDPGESGTALTDLKDVTERFESNYIKEVIERVGGDKKEAAQQLGIGLSSLYRKLEDQ
ncbi:MAG: sigma-54-dependent Fis family transcriptional regulator [Candidatus Lindowbacteria bacterium]|nr:sigma-54-dependent Fis family transcriptional regulator [Candidatus Lindowbacteria bacterium]